MSPYKSVALPSPCLLSQIDLFYLEQGVFLVSAPHNLKWTSLRLMHHPQTKTASKVLLPEFLLSIMMLRARERSRALFQAAAEPMVLAGSNPPCTWSGK